MSGILYLVPTPIGNLGDISRRAAETLAAADFIAAEDTRVSVKLLNHLEIKKPLVSYHEHNKRESGPKILERLLAGERCALVTDAGSPAISDPGEDLEKAARRETLEETGFAMNSCRLVKTFYPQIGRSDHCFNLFVGTGPEKASEKYDEGETFGLKWFTMEEAKALVKSDNCRDGFALLALNMWFAGALDE